MAFYVYFIVFRGKCVVMSWELGLVLSLIALVLLLIFTGLSAANVATPSAITITTVTIIDANFFSVLVMFLFLSFSYIY